ncbi:hypothetical protein [Nocardiopsis sp. JB363]|uniref:hypothetical protein n=1 Tax=Nocardiopsis sp. JB363 TaxID=1434837 RepID=UPI00097A7696|nr:hypothetical protein [Nocardiopsis sp. JB363]SIO91252.1 hypothetical protein BQ8420_30800 [Nocardiopsis sp. JB363]
MRKHQTRWVALFSAAAISTSGLVGLAGPAAADEDTKALSWPVVSQGVSSYSLDGYRIAYLPPGLDRYGINANSTTDRQGDSRSQLSWVQGPDQLYGRVAVLRSENLQELDDLRSSRYSHLADSSLEELPESETFEHGAYLAEETGDLFWLASPGVAVTTHLQPDRWESDELVRMAESVAEPAAPATPVTEEAEEAEAPEEKTPEEETPQDEVPEEEAPENEAPEDATPEDEAPVEDAPANEDAPEEAPEDDVTPQAPQDEAPEEDATDEETTEEEGADTAPVDEVSDETPAEDADEDGAQEADLPEATTSQEAKTCLVEHFVDLESGSTDLDQEQMAPASQEFVEQALNADDLDEADLDRLLATAWYYGDESDKVAAIDECAQSLGMGSDEVEDAIAEVADQIGALVEEAGEAMAEAMDQAEQASTDAQDAADTTDAASADMEDPVGAEEWEELWDSLPWSIPAETS